VIFSGAFSQVTAVDSLFPDNRDYDRIRTTWSVTAFNNTEHAVNLGLSAEVKSTYPNATPGPLIFFNGAFVPPGGSTTVSLSRDYMGANSVPDSSWSIRNVSGYSYFVNAQNGCPGFLEYAN